jgi:peptidoglycan/LPS O-acetylase OafA/YrhL
MNLDRTSMPRYPVLDGWRGVSILLVLCGHLLPLGPKFLALNGAVAAMGMAIFFTLSGFLITSFLLHRPSIGSFLIRRLFRIVPLAWVTCIGYLLLHGADLNVWLAHLLFYGNLPPFYLLPATSHMWSLCLEMQFYVAIALLVATLGRGRLPVLVFLCVAVTIARVVWQQPITIVTWFRIDEILVGCTVALLRHRYPQGAASSLLAKVPLALLLVALLLSCHEQFLPLNYLRPYLAGGVVACTLFCGETWLAKAMHNRVLGYLATVSYALYVLHPFVADTWLGDGDKLEKYLKRPLYFAVLFALAHLSTRYFERRCIEAGRALESRWLGVAKA